MKIKFRLAWAKGEISSKHFKTTASYEFFSEYVKRLSYFASVEASGFDVKKPETGKAVRWFCHSSKEAKLLSSEELSRAVEKLRQNGTKELEISIGPADGFSKENLQIWKPDLLWSFGPMTLPHELASVVAAEQVYRAFTILAGQPYHVSH